jgi:hypothetical protein
LIQQSLIEPTKPKLVCTNSVTTNSLTNSPVSYQTPITENTPVPKLAPIISYANVTRKAIGRGAGRGIIFNDINRQ